MLFVVDDPPPRPSSPSDDRARSRPPTTGSRQVRAGLAYGAVVSRLANVYGPTVNIAARLTSVARPGTVLVDRGAYEALSGNRTEDAEPG